MPRVTHDSSSMGPKPRVRQGPGSGGATGGSAGTTGGTGGVTGGTGGVTGGSGGVTGGSGGATGGASTGGAAGAGGSGGGIALACATATFAPPSGSYHRLGVSVRIEATGDEVVFVNASYARVTDSEEYFYSSSFGGCEPELKTDRLKKGEISEGWINFEMPDKVKGLKLTYAPYVDSDVGGARQPLTFDLER